jgi:hypothetical protein
MVGSRPRSFLYCVLQELLLHVSRSERIREDVSESNVPVELHELGKHMDMWQFHVYGDLMSWLH